MRETPTGSSAKGPDSPDRLAERLARLYGHRDGLWETLDHVEEQIDKCLCKLVEAEWGPESLHASQAALYKVRFGLGPRMDDVTDERPQRSGVNGESC